MDDKKKLIENRKMKAIMKREIIIEKCRKKVKDRSGMQMSTVERIAWNTDKREHSNWKTVVARKM